MNPRRTPAISRQSRFHLNRRRSVCSWLLALLGAICFAGGISKAIPADVTFIHIGFLPGDDHSLVNAVDDAVTLAGCSSYSTTEDPPYRLFKYAARWTPADGLQALPRPPDTPAADPKLSSARALDVTADGSRIAFFAPTEDGSGVAAGISDADGSNLVALTGMPGGELMSAVNQLSDDGQTAVGFSLGDNYYGKGAIWTAADGFQALVPPAGFTNVLSASRAISADGKISAGDLVQVSDYDYVLAEEAYRWTSAGGISELGFLPGESDSCTEAMSPDGKWILGESGNSFFLWQEGKGIDRPAHPPAAHAVLRPQVWHRDQR